MAVWYVGSTKWSAVTAWAASTAYSVGDLRRQLATPTKTQERVWRCTTAGTSGGTEPAWTLSKGSTTNDGTAVWTEVTGDTAYGWGAAGASIYHMMQWAAAGDRIYVSSSHSGDLGSNSFTFTSPGTSASPLEIVCVNDSAAPPTAVATGAVEANNNGFDGRWTMGGHAYWYGVELQSGGDSFSFSFGNSDSFGYTFDNCVIYHKNAASDVKMQIGGYSDSKDDQGVTLINTQIRLSHATHLIWLCGNLTWHGGGLHASTTVPTTFMTTLSNVVRGRAELSGLDLSVAGSGKTLFDLSGGSTYYIDLIDSKLGASVTLVSGTIASCDSVQFRMVNSDSADTNYRYYKKDYRGEVFSETTIVKASTLSTDGTTPLTWKMVSSANVRLYGPLQSDWMAVWCDSTGSKTITINVLTDNVTLTDAEAWLEVEYLGTSGFPIASIANDRAASVLATPANQTTDGVSSWTTTGLGTPVKQNLAVTVTVNEKGPIRCRVCLAKSSTTVYVDAAPVVT